MLKFFRNSLDEKETKMFSDLMKKRQEELHSSYIQGYDIKHGYSIIE